MKKTITLLLLFFFIAQYNFAQDKKEKAHNLSVEGIKLTDEGKYDEAIKLFEQAKKLDPDNLDHSYEMAYAWYLKKDYKKAIKILEKLTSHADVSDHVYQLLGNSYDYAGDQKKAIATYENGLKKFPDSGKLYLEQGVIQLGNKAYSKAIEFFETGIKVDPQHSSNYYWAARIYCGSTEKVWGMIYGELFMNLERNTKRTVEISKLLFDTYKKQITFTSDTSASVSFSSNTIEINNTTDPTKFKLPFGLGVYEPTLLFSIVGENKIDLQSLNNIRTKFLHAYSDNRMTEYPNALFAYQEKVSRAGHLEAYNYWVLMKGDEEEFSKWYDENKEEWEQFIEWFSENPIQLNDKNKFYRFQY